MKNLALLLQNVPALTLSNLLAILGFISIVGSSVVILRSRDREEAHKATERLAKTLKDSLELKESDLRKADAEIQKAKAEVEAVRLEIARVEEERETFRTAYTALSGINVKELLNFDFIRRERDALEAECTRLHNKITAGRFEGAENNGK